MNTSIQFLLAMSCLIPAMIGAIRYRFIDSKYYPFILSFIITVPVEVVSYLYKIGAIPYGEPAAVAVNIYQLVNLYLFLHFIHINNYLTKKSVNGFMWGAIVVALLNSFATKAFFSAYLIYLICYASIVMLALAVNILTNQVTEIRGRLLNSFWFWISSAAILYNANALLIFGLSIFPIKDVSYLMNIKITWAAINTSCYIIFGAAILLIPSINRKAKWSHLVVK